MSVLPAAAISPGMELPTFGRQVKLDNMIEFERVVWDRGVNVHNDPEQAARDGISRPIASGQNQMAFLHELLECNLGNGWVYGGKIFTRWIHPVYPDDEITPHAVVTEIIRDNGRDRATFEIWCTNQGGEKTAVGTATAFLPEAAKVSEMAEATSDRCANPAFEESGVWSIITVGEDLPSYEYVLTERMLQDYRQVVDNSAALFPTVAARHPDHCFRNRYEGRMLLPNCGYDNEYFNAPLPGKRIRVTGRIADKYVRRGKRYLVVEATAVDEDGRLIEKNRLIGLAMEAGTPPLAEVARKWEN